MVIIKHRFWTLAREGELVTLRQYETTTELRGDDAWHKGMEKMCEIVTTLNELPAVIRAEDIKEFSDEENASWLLQQSKDS